MTTIVYHPVIAGLAVAVPSPDVWVEQGWLLDDPSAPPSTDYTHRTTGEDADHGE